MTRISSKSTYFQKRIVPVVWFGLLLAFASVAMGLRLPVLLIGALVMGVVGFFVMKKRVWDLADEVYDCGDSLLVRYRGVEERILMTAIESVNASTTVNPRRVVLQLNPAGPWGAQIAFIPMSALRLNHFANNPIAQDLAARVRGAKESSAHRVAG